MNQPARPTALQHLDAFAAIYDEAISNEPPHRKQALTGYAAGIYKAIAEVLKAGEENAATLEVIKAEQAAKAAEQTAGGE